ncbi:MAG: hypothetical protein JSV50_09555 [Desulfobacteraceae bacterium]|nr:MAG: hypothetical protein JSV50_09555 [Desulfobacteraceae bacterium]
MAGHSHHLRKRLKSRSFRYIVPVLLIIVLILAVIYGRFDKDKESGRAPFQQSQPEPPPEQIPELDPEQELPVTELKQDSQAVTIVTDVARITNSIGTKSKKNVEDNFNINWTKTSYTKTVSLGNTEVSEDQEQDVSERISLSCEVEILDPNFVLGISKIPVIEEITDDKGDKIEIDSKPSSSFRIRYETLRYERRFMPTKKSAKQKTTNRSAPRPAPKESSRSRWVDVIRPSGMEIDLNVRLGEKFTEKINHIKGYFYVLIAQSYEYVDLPFKKSDKWVRLTPDMKVRVTEASLYRLSTEGRREGRFLSGNLYTESYLPARLVIARQLVSLDNKKPNHHNIRPSLPYQGGSLSVTVYGQNKKIRYVIAVNPAHYKIPFVLEDIPLPMP